ncbi:MAG: hypothetical protein EB060_06415 [Proteobacteria bacterium]|nr:hypothetical protein [Pseudomonadota bacterium]
MQQASCIPNLELAKELALAWTEGRKADVFNVCHNDSLLLLSIASLLPEKEGQTLIKAWIENPA